MQNMKSIESTQLSRSLKSVLEEVANGQEFEITKYAKVVAYLGPARIPEQDLSSTPLSSNRDPVVTSRDKPPTWADRNPRQAGMDDLLKRMK